jgi:hypothetical protein
MRSVIASGCLVVAISGCGGETSPEPEPEPEVSYYQDIKPVFDAYCIECHDEGGVGPFSLASYDATAAVASLLPAAVESRQMPPFLAAPTVRPLQFDRSLSDEQIEMISTWVELGAPMGDPDDEAPPLELPAQQLERQDRVLEMPVAYSPTLVPDEYRCFVLDWPETEARYISGIEYFPGNLAIAHHAVVYLVDEQYAGTIDEADGADGLPGYSCFGGASPAGAPAFPTKLLSGWGPGVGARLYPEGSGALILPNTRVVLQMHYSILNDGPQPDQTRVAFQLEDTVEFEAGYLPILDPNWPGNPDSMLIPAGDPEVTHEHVGDPTASPLLSEFVPGANASEGIVLHSILPHMHKLGKSMFVRVERQDGTLDPMVEISRWDFDWQGEYVFEEPLAVYPGDVIRLSCTWDNSAENQPVIQGEVREPEDVRWGEGTYDEMCAASVFMTTVAQGDSSCEDLGSVPASQGRFIATFDASSSVRESANLEGELRGLVVVSAYRDEDVTLTGPVPGAEPVGNVVLDEVDIRTGPSEPILLDLPLPGGDYQLLGFMDSDGNADPSSPSPDAYDPVLIPGLAHHVACDTQPTTLTFPLLLPP